jgi:CheY-like chemotaxis protein
MPRILIADDDRDLAQALALRCRGLGVEVQMAHDARTALNMLFDAPPDVVCLDVNMPCGNGLCVCEMLAADGQFTALPVIILTGDSNPEVVRRCHMLCAYYVPKCADLWSRVGPLLAELLDLPSLAEPSAATA